MKYDIRVTITLGNVSMEEVTELQEAITSLLDEYPIKDKNLQIGDSGKYIRPPFGE